MNRLTIGALALALALPGNASTALAALGPPWISIEYPVNPYDQATKDAYLVVHAFHHGTAMAFPVAGTAEGMVRGERKSVSLEFRATSRPGVYALKRQWPTEGTWTLVVSVTQGPDDAVYAIIDLGADGLVASVRVPTRVENGYTLPAKLAMNAVDASLRARAQASSVGIR